jgi:hypothetical protein
MWRLSAEVVNGAIFAGLVVLASEMQWQAPLPRLTEPSQQSATGSDLRAVRTESFAASSLVSVSPASDRAQDTVRAPATEQVPSMAAAGDRARETREQDAAVTLTALPAAAPPERSALKPVPVRTADESKIDAYVPPIRRQRPVTPPLAFNVPAEKGAAAASRKAAKSQVKRAAARKAQEPARSSLGAGARAKVASETAPSANQVPVAKTKQ